MLPVYSLSVIVANEYFSNVSYISADVPAVPLWNFGSYFLLIQNMLTAVASILIYGGMFEFICAQSPHSMKGFLFQLLSVLGILLPFNISFNISFVYNTSQLTFPSCGFGYYLVNIVISIIGVIAFTYTAKKYKYRQRDDVL